MTALIPTTTERFAVDTNPALTATAALRTGLFQPISNADPDLGRRATISPDAPTFFGRIFGR